MGSWPPRAPCAGRGGGAGDAAAAPLPPSPRLPQGHQGQPRRLCPAWTLGRKRLKANLGRHAGKGEHKAIFFPAPNGEETAFLLQELDFLRLEKNKKIHRGRVLRGLARAERGPSSPVSICVLADGPATLGSSAAGPVARDLPCVQAGETGLQGTLSKYSGFSVAFASQRSYKM